MLVEIPQQKTYLFFPFLESVTTFPIYYHLQSTKPNVNQHNTCMHEHVFNQAFQNHRKLFNSGKQKKKYLSNQTIKGVSVYELRYVFVLIHDIRRNCYFFFKFSWTLRRGTKSMFLSLSRDKIKTLAPLRDAHESCQKQHVVFKLIHFT